MSPLHPDDVAAFARISRELLEEAEVVLTLQQAVDVAAQTIEGCDFAGITLRHGTQEAHRPPQIRS